MHLNLSSTANARLANAIFSLVSLLSLVSLSLLSLSLLSLSLYSPRDLACYYNFDLNACFSLLFVCLCIYCVRACVRACFSKFFFSLFTFFVFFGISRTLLILRKSTKVVRSSFLFWANRIAATPFASSLYACELISGKPLYAAIFGFSCFGFSFDRISFP